ncbi:hypothetical protein CSPX01_04735 [Colletotrichum filicis]|nr:hypothetical protein CSPX01_04735 [Colletotrichum filicis]
MLRLREATLDDQPPGDDQDRECQRIQQQRAIGTAAAASSRMSGLDAIICPVVLASRLADANPIIRCRKTGSFYTGWHPRVKHTERRGTRAKAKHSAEHGLVYVWNPAVSRRNKLLPTLSETDEDQPLRLTVYRFRTYTCCVSNVHETNSAMFVGAVSTRSFTGSPG